MLLTVEKLSKSYQQYNRLFAPKQHILRDISFCLKEKENLGVVGESGSGKSTLARLLAGIEKPDSGKILLNNQPRLSGKISIVFQDYRSSINPAMTVEQAITEPLPPKLFSASQQRELVAENLRKVGLSPDLMHLYPHQLSGGQAQRICISRALINQPKLIILDEAISSLDVPNQVQILDLLIQLQQNSKLSYLFITHDIQALCYLCQRAIFLQKGEIVAQSDISKLFQLKHAYARSLIQAIL